MREKILGLLAMAMFGALAQPVLANTAYAPGQGGRNSIEVGIEVRASVKDKCGFATGGAPAGTLDQADFDLKGFSKDFAIVLNCTGASRVAVSSRNGGLTTATTADGFASKAPYEVELKMVADSGTTANGSCGASTLSGAGGCTFAGSATSSNGLRLAAASTKANGSYLRVKSAVYGGATPLIAGRYSDTLTITVSAAP